MNPLSPNLIIAPSAYSRTATPYSSTAPQLNRLLRQLSASHFPAGTIELRCEKTKEMINLKNFGNYRKHTFGMNISDRQRQPSCLIGMRYQLGCCTSPGTSSRTRPWRSEQRLSPRWYVSWGYLCIYVAHPIKINDPTYSRTLTFRIELTSLLQNFVLVLIGRGGCLQLRQKQQQTDETNKLDDFLENNQF